MEDITIDSKHLLEQQQQITLQIMEHQTMIEALLKKNQIAQVLQFHLHLI